MSNPPVAQLEKSIRALTTIIQLLQPQSRTPAEIPIPPKQSNYRALNKAYNHIATLLTQGSETEDGAVVAVTGNSSSSGISVTALEEIDRLPSIPTQNPDWGPDDGVLMKVQEIRPSEKTLEELADPSNNLQSQEVTLIQHASDLFRALVDLSKDRENHMVQFMQFVWLRCHRKIKHRLAADEVMLGTPLPTLLGEWRLADSDVVEEKWFKANPDLHPHFKRVKIPSRLHEETQSRQYQFSRSTIPAWCTVFRVALRVVKTLAERCDMQVDSITDLNQALNTLNCLLYDNRAFETLLALPSLANSVDHAMRAADKKRRAQQPEKSLDISQLDEGFDPVDPSRNPVLHCCKAVVAWLRAGMSLSRSKLFLGPLPKFHVVSSYVPGTHISSMLDLRNLMIDVILPKLERFQGVDNKALIQQLLDREDFANKTKFTGKIHCEATLMALVHSFSSTSPSKRVLPFSEQRTRDLRPLFSKADRVVGVGKKSCLCCYWLAQLLRVNDDGAFLVPGTHGIVFPWTPPLFGIPASVLEQLEQILIHKLTKITEDWIMSQSVPYPSRQSSPASQSSDDEGPSGIICLLEHERWWHLGEEE